MAHFITSMRIICSIALLFCPVYSISFTFLYLLAGISDMLDGFVARQTGSESTFGARFDSIADFIFVLICFFKFIPVIHLSMCLIIWILVIAMIRIGNLVYGYLIKKEFIMLHTLMNKVTGLLLYILPLTLTFIDINKSAFAVCVLATCASIQETYLIYRLKS